MVEEAVINALDIARRDCATRAGVSEPEVVVAAVKKMRWPDASLGCPEPGKKYPEVPTDGYEIILIAISREYVYHTDMNGRVVFCGKRLQG